ncbi:MAG: hypothetical protein ACKVW3_12120 [Phycisphaerales bacterium]
MTNRARPCISCGYDLGETATGSPCPECGKPAYDERDAFDHRGSRNQRWRITIAIAITTGIAAGFIFLWRTCEAAGI